MKKAKETEPEELDDIEEMEDADEGEDDDAPVESEKPSKAPRIAAQREKKDVESEDGQAMKKNKKKSSVVALKHKRVMDNLVAQKKDGKSRISLFQAMIDAGYSEEYARSGHIKTKKSWGKLLDERLGDDKLTNIHAQLMVAKKLDYMLFVSEMPDQDIYDLIDSVGCVPKKIIHGIAGTHVWFWAPDNKTRKDALDLAYKARGKFAPEKIEIEQTGLRSLTDAELANLIKKQKARFTKKD